MLSRFKIYKGKGYISLFTLNNQYRLCHVSPSDQGKEGSRHLLKDEVQLDRCEGEKSGVAVISLNRPQAKNAISARFLHLFTEAVEALKHDKSVRAVIVRSNVPGIFCAGADLKEVRLYLYLYTLKFFIIVIYKCIKSEPKWHHQMLVLL